MNKLHKILCIIFGVLILACLALEFIPVTPIIRQILLAVTAFYALICMIYFELIKKN